MTTTARRELIQREAKEATRRAILDAALNLFVNQGYAQVSIRNIAAEIGYSAGAIYSYFESKDDIFLALAEEGFRLLGASHLAHLPTERPLDDLSAVAWHFYDFSKQHPEYFALVFLDRRVPRIGHQCEGFAFMADIKEALNAKVQRCIDAGLFPPTLNAKVALRLLWAPVLGIASLRLSGRLSPDEDPDALMRDAINTTMAGLRTGAVSGARSIDVSTESC